MRYKFSSDFASLIQSNFCQIYKNFLKNSQIKGDFDRKIQNCVSVKQQIIDNIIDLRDSMENIGLSADKILYDNSVMMDKIFKNFSQLIHICS